MAAETEVRGEIRDVAIADLSRHPSNYRQHPQAQLDRIAESLRRNGQRKAIVVQAETMRIIAGHGVVEAAQSLGWETVRCDVWDCTDDQAAAYMVDDNELSRLAEDDDAVLAGILVELQDTEFPPISFDESELNALLEQSMTPGPFDDAEPQEPPEDPETKPGDVWVFGEGEHRLVCGDCTEAHVWEALFGDKLARMVWTDPPYGVSYQDNESVESLNARNRRTDGLVVANDSMTEAQTEELARDALTMAAAYGVVGASCYVACPAGTLLPHFIAAFDQSGFKFMHSLAWAKQQFVFGRCDYHYRHEIILYGWKPDGAHYFVDDRTKDSVFEVDRPHQSKQHPTMKPLELVVPMVENSSKRGDIVADPFCGSGTTLLACAKTGRHGYGIELSERYVDVCCKRYIDATGKPVVLEATGERFPYERAEKQE